MCCFHSWPVQLYNCFSNNKKPCTCSLLPVVHVHQSTSQTPSSIVATWLQSRTRPTMHINVGRTIKCGHAVRGGVSGRTRFFHSFKSQRACAVSDFSDLVCCTTVSFFILPTTLRRRFTLTQF